MGSPRCDRRIPRHRIAELEREIHVALDRAGIRGRGVVGHFDGYTETYLAENLPVEEETFHNPHVAAVRWTALSSVDRPNRLHCSCGVSLTTGPDDVLTVRA